MLSLLIYGSRISLFIGVVGTLLACTVGITLGLIRRLFWAEKWMRLSCVLRISCCLFRIFCRAFHQ